MGTECKTVSKDYRSRGAGRWGALSPPPVISRTIQRGPPVRKHGTLEVRCELAGSRSRASFAGSGSRRSETRLLTTAASSIPSLRQRRPRPAGTPWAKPWPWTCPKPEADMETAEATARMPASRIQFLSTSHRPSTQSKVGASCRLQRTPTCPSTRRSKGGAPHPVQRTHMCDSWHPGL